MKPEIKRYHHGAGDFWQQMGPMFASASIRKELGNAISSDEHYTWWLALIDGTVVGFVGLEVTPTMIRLRHDYVLPAYRRQGIHRALFATRLAYAMEFARPVQIVVCPQAQQLPNEFAFRAIRTRGQYTVMEKVP